MTKIGTKYTSEHKENIRKGMLGKFRNPNLKVIKCPSCNTPFRQARERNKYCSRPCSKYIGNAAGYLTRHKRIYKKWGKADKCEACKIDGLNYTWANISKKYDTDNRSDWVKLCRGCHIKFDRWGYTLKELGYDED